MSMVLPQGSCEAARSVADVLGAQGFDCVIREDDKYGWVVEVVGRAEDAK